MSQQDTAHAWWSRLRHQGLLLSPVVMLERFPAAPEPAPFHKTARLRDAYARFVSTAEARQGEAQLEQSAILAWTDALLENYVGHGKTRIANQHSIPENLTAAIRISNKSDTIRPHRVGFVADANGGGEVFEDAVLVGDPRLAVADVVLQQCIGPGKDGRLLQLRFALASFRRGNEAGVGIP